MMGGQLNNIWFEFNSTADRLMTQTKPQTECKTDARN